MADNENSTMTPEARLARAWDLFRRVKRQSERIDAQIRAVQTKLAAGVKDVDDEGVSMFDALSLTETAAEMSEDGSNLYALEKMLRPREVTA